MTWWKATTIRVPAIRPTLSAKFGIRILKDKENPEMKAQLMMNDVELDKEKQP